MALTAPMKACSAGAPPACSSTRQCTSSASHETAEATENWVLPCLSRDRCPQRTRSCRSSASFPASAKGEGAHPCAPASCAPSNLPMSARKLHTTTELACDRATAAQSLRRVAPLALAHARPPRGCQPRAHPSRTAGCLAASGTPARGGWPLARSSQGLPSHVAEHTPLRRATVNHDESLTDPTRPPKRCLDACTTKPSHEFSATPAARDAQAPRVSP